VIESPEEKAAAKYAEAQARHTSLLSAFERSLRITDELYQRLEKELYVPGPGGRMYNPQLAKDVVALSRALAQAGAVHARLLNDEAARADAMSEADKIKYMVAALKTKPKSIREAVVRELNGP
jgi:hypothetical protein